MSGGGGELGGGGHRIPPTLMVFARSGATLGAWTRLAENVGETGEIEPTGETELG